MNQPLPDLDEPSAPLPTAEQLLKEIVGEKVLAPRWPRQLVNPDAWPSVGRAQEAHRKQAVKATRASIDQLVARQAVANKVERITAILCQNKIIYEIEKSNKDDVMVMVTARLGFFLKIMCDCE